MVGIQKIIIFKFQVIILLQVTIYIFLTHNIYVNIIMSTPLPWFPVRAEEGVFSERNCIHFLFVIEGKIRFAKINWNKGDNINWLTTSGRWDPSAVVLSNNNQLQTGFTSVHRGKKYLLYTLYIILRYYSF